jgi:tetratricopeptide (TPR) repeat protein
VIIALFPISIVAHKSLNGARPRSELFDKYLLQPVSKIDPRAIFGSRFNAFYLPRRTAEGDGSADELARAALIDAAKVKPGTANLVGLCVVGPKAAGSSRLAWEAMRHALPTWTLVKWPAKADDPFEDLTQLKELGGKYVLWLDDLGQQVDAFVEAHQLLPSVEQLPAILRSHKTQCILVATTSELSDFGPAHDTFPLLFQRLHQVKIGTLTPAEAQQLEQAVADPNASPVRQYGYRTASELLPGSIILGVTGLRDRVYPRLSESAKRYLWTMKLLALVGVASPPSNMLIGAAEAVFGVPQQDANDALDALRSSGFVKYGEVVDAQQTVAPEYSLYLDLAIPDYSIDESHTPDLARLAEWFLKAYPSHRATVKVRLGDALVARHESSIAARCFGAALESLSREMAPTVWAQAQFGLGLLGAEEIESQSDRTDSEMRAQVEERLRSAAEAFEAGGDTAKAAEAFNRLVDLLQRARLTTTTSERTRFYESMRTRLLRNRQLLENGEDVEAKAIAEINFAVLLTLLGRSSADSPARRASLEQAITVLQSAISESAQNPEMGQTILTAKRALADALFARASYARTSNRVRYLREGISTLREVLVTTESSGPTYDRGRLHLELAEALEAVATAESDPQALTEAVSEYQEAADDLRADVFALEKAEALASAGRALARLRDLEPAAASKAVLLTRAVETLEASLRTRGGRGKLFDRDTIRLELANLYLERATKVPGPSGSSGCTDVANGRAHLTTILSHVGNEVAPIQTKAKQALRKINTQARALGCA